MANEESDPSKRKNFFATLPGILTSIAAIVTALTALVAALKQSGWIDFKSKPATEVRSQQNTGSASNKGGFDGSDPTRTDSAEQIAVRYVPARFKMPGLGV